MSRKKHFVLLTIFSIVFVALAILYIITKSFLLSNLLHIALRLLCVPIIIQIIQKCFKEQITYSMKKALVLCGIALTLDLVIIETIRFILNNGVSTVLFVPICLPLCFMILMFFSAKDTGKEKSREKTATFLIGVPILILAVYFEVYSFIQI